jgi:hypothetical protein
MASSYTLSLPAVDVLSQTLDLNTRLFPFEIPSFGRLQVDRTRIARAVFSDLAGHGLIKHGELDPDLRLALRTLADFRIAVAAMGTIEAGKPLFARASANGDNAVLAVQQGERLRLEPIRPTALAVSMVGLLPKLDAGVGQSVTLTKPAEVGARGDYLSELRPSHGKDAALRIAEGYLSKPRTGSGFFAVSGRDRHGREVRAGEVAWFDTDAGRYLNLSHPPDYDGQIHGTFSPADPPRLTQSLTQLISVF